MPTDTDGYRRMPTDRPG